MVVINAACRAKDVAWMGGHTGDATFEDVSDDLALLAVQGPRAVALVSGLCRRRRQPTSRPFHFKDTQGRRGSRRGLADRVHRRGRLRALRGRAPTLPASGTRCSRPARRDGLIPCGLGARDTLRLEAGLRLYGQDMDDSTDPYSCALGWTVKPQKGEFIGSAALARLDPKHPPRRFVGITLRGPGHRPPRPARPRRRQGRPARSRAGRTASRSTTRSPPRRWTATSRPTPSSRSTSEAPSPRRRSCRFPSIAAPREPERGRSLQLPVHRQPRVGPRRRLERRPSGSPTTPRRSSAT